VYIDKLSELLLHENLRDSQPEAEARTIARVRTITILFQLDARRIGYVFAFLRDAGLMSTEQNGSIVSLKEADLRKINLSHTDLSEADLSGASLVGADLSGASLSGTLFSDAQLKQAKTLQGATMPDGSIHL